jgi:hypothetical protein
MKREAGFKSEVGQSQDFKSHLYRQGAHISQNMALCTFATVYTPKQQ